MFVSLGFFYTKGSSVWNSRHDEESVIRLVAQGVLKVLNQIKITYLNCICIMDRVEIRSLFLMSVTSSANACESQLPTCGKKSKLKLNLGGDGVSRVQMKPWLCSVCREAASPIQSGHIRIWDLPNP